MKNQEHYSTHIWQEIQEQPAAIERALDRASLVLAEIVAEVARREIEQIVLVARGTSDHAALYGQYLFQYLNGIPVALATPSVITLYGARPRLGKALVIGISQSGAAPDVVGVIQQARAAGALTVGITNGESSLLAGEVDYALFCSAGPELSVAATKTYTTTCALLALLAASLPGGEVLRDHIKSLPDLVTAALTSEFAVSAAVLRYVHARDCVVLGRAFHYCTARESALKLAETCYLVATPYSTADFRHGPTAIVEQGRTVLLYAPTGRTLPDNLDLLKLLKTKGADTLVVSPDPALLELATSPIAVHLPPLVGNIRGYGAETDINVEELLSPIAYIVYGQFLALHLSLARGLDPDHPRGLTKVTLTM